MFVTFAYSVTLVQDGDEWLARAPQFPEVLTGAGTRDEAMALVEDALEEAVLGRLARGEIVPLPSPQAEADDLVLLPPDTAGRVLIDVRRRERGWSKRDLAQAIGKDEKVARRLLDGRGKVSMGLIGEALAAMGERITLGFAA